MEGKAREERRGMKCYNLEVFIAGTRIGRRARIVWLKGLRKVKMGVGNVR